MRPQQPQRRADNWRDSIAHADAQLVPQNSLHLSGKSKWAIELQPEFSPISQEQLAAEVKGIYAGLVMVEAKCINIDSQKASPPEERLGKEQWQALVALHRTLLYEHNDFLMATQPPSANPALLGLAKKYSMPARMRSSHNRQPYGLERSSPFTHRSTAALIYEPEILGFMHDTAVTFFPDSQSAYDIMSYDYAKRNHFKINSSTKGKLRTARGAMVNTLGTVSQPIRFAEESETYMREFHVLPKCVHDIILGSPFLRLTQTFTKFRHRVVNKLRGLSPRHRVCFTGSSQQMLAGWANGRPVLALPDTGSDICLMSAQYARERGYRVDTDPRYRQLLEFVDGSTAETLGRVEGFQWEFDKSDIQLHTPEIHVLEGLQTDLLLGYDFLMETDAFSTHEELFVDIEPHDEHVGEMFGWLACTVRLVTKLGLKSRSRSAGKC
jgi:hypothetical protein